MHWVNNLETHGTVDCTSIPALSIHMIHHTPTTWIVYWWIGSWKYEMVVITYGVQVLGEAMEMTSNHCWL